MQIKLIVVVVVVVVVVIGIELYAVLLKSNSSKTYRSPFLYQIILGLCLSLRVNVNSCNGCCGQLDST